MLLHGGIDRSREIQEMLGKASLWSTVERILLPHRKTFHVLDANDELIDLFARSGSRPVCKLEIRPKGVLVHFKADERYFLCLTYAGLSFFKGGDYLKLYKDKWQIKLLLENEKGNHRWVIGELLKSRSAHGDTDYYGNALE